jgi:hypothetical protein
MDLTGITYSIEVALCAYADTTSCDCTCLMNSPGCILPLFSTPMRKVERESIVTIHTLHVTLVSCLQTPHPVCLLQDSQSSQQQTSLFESTENPVDIHQPPPHVVNYWFDRLGLSLDPTPSENPSNATSSPFQFPLLDGISYVSSLLSISCRTTFFRLVYAPRDF